jgi:ketosteroid isomerase-like protein
MTAALALLADDVVLFYSNGSAIQGKEAFSAAMAANWKLVQDYRYATADQDWIAESDAAAAVIYSFAWSGMARGESVTGAGRGTRVFRKTEAGWLLAHEHLSAGEWKA